VKAANFSTVIIEAFQTKAKPNNSLKNYGSFQKSWFVFAGE
jgi:hypothetical protein